MPYFLAKRDEKSVERMDDLHCDKDALINTYRQFSTINSMISGWKKIYKSQIRPLFFDSSHSYSLLDIGFGGGDIPIKMAKWAQRDGIALHITAIETDRRAVEFAESLPAPDNVNFRYASSTEMVSQGCNFDVVISNHLLHHLSHKQLLQLLNESKQLSKKRVLFNDIERSDIGYMLFNLFSRPVFRNSFITKDGLTSIKRSYTLTELCHAMPDEWKTERRFPFRLLVRYDHQE